jgi:putative transposase
MTNIRRYFRPGNVYFLTHVTHERIPILVDNSDLLWQALQSVNSNLRFDIVAWVVLPDHFHLVIDPVDNNVSRLMKGVKLSFSTNYRKRVGMRSGRMWQYRFWDHVIRDQADLNRHVDYIHYNPVKHRLTASPFEWEHSSIHKYFREGYYPDDWGMKEPLEFEGAFGE